MLSVSDVMSFVVKHNILYLDIVNCNSFFSLHIPLFFFFILASPSAPKDFKVAEVTRQHVHLMWEAPEHDGGSPLTGYQIEKRDVSRKTWVKVWMNISLQTTQQYTCNNLLI